jgi:thiamine kinase-like enzyme
MREILLRLVCRNYSFWDLPCYECGSRNGWHISFCRWRINSFIAIAECRRCLTKQFLKKISQPQTDVRKNHLKSEYETLELLNCEEERVATFLLPRPYHYSAIASAFSMQYIHGETLDKKLSRARRKEEVDDCLHISATWLKQLHKTHFLLDHCTPGIDYITALQGLEADCGTLTNQNKIVSRSLELMRYSLNIFESLPIKYVPIHGDFKASNIICTPDRKVYGIDYIVRFKSHAAMDIAQFLIDILLNEYCAKTLANENHLQYILDCFLRVYGENTQQNKNIIAWWLIYFLLSRWIIDSASMRPSFLFAKKYNDTLLKIIALC